MKAARRFDLSPSDAIQLQKVLSPLIERVDRLGRNGVAGVRHIAGLDIAFADQGRTTIAAAVLMRFPSLELIGEVRIEQPTRFPYVPGLLSFRELPAGLVAIERLPVRPDLVLCDGQGYAHPRRFGLACHLGLALDLPSIGVAKSRLIGTATEPGPERGDTAFLRHHDEIIGMVLRTRRKVRPLYVSVGHRVSLETAVALTLQATTRYRLPEPLRRADQLSKT
ncbi:MAG: deoxyribonuclease V [Alphaproteobacteria bacterium]|nr:deoxyribonuclease V [Alphaproteobacteria bacterium]